MSKSLSEILQKYGEGVDSQGWYEGYDEALADIKAWAEEVIGEDEPHANMKYPYQCSACGIADEPVVRNVLRAGQRKRLDNLESE